MAPRQDLKARSFAFSVTVLDLCKRLIVADHLHAHMGQQLFRAVSSIGSNLEEGEVANSRRDMANKYAVALRESREAMYWLRLIAVDVRWTKDAGPLIAEASEFVAMLTVSVKKLRAEPP